MCHADVVKKAIESLKSDPVLKNWMDCVPAQLSSIKVSRPSNPRLNGLAQSNGGHSTSSDLVLSRLDNTDGRNRSDHASHLNATSQFLRDTCPERVAQRTNSETGVLEINSERYPLGKHHTTKYRPLSTA